MNPIDDKIISRIRKMMALANDAAASEGERENALRMSHSLLARHNLSMASLSDEKQEARQKDADMFYGRPWAISVASSMAKLFFCSYYFSRSGTKNMVYHTFIGKESNTLTAKEMAKYLVGSILKEGNRRMRELGENVTWRRSFCTGVSAQIYSRVIEMIKKQPDDVTSPSMALALASLYDTEAAANRAMIIAAGTKITPNKHTGKKTVEGGAYADGKSYGNSVNLNRQVGTTAGAKVLRLK